MLHATSIYLHVRDTEPLLSCSDVTVKLMLNSVLTSIELYI